MSNQQACKLYLRHHCQTELFCVIVTYTDAARQNRHLDSSLQIEFFQHHFCISAEEQLRNNMWVFSTLSNNLRLFQPAPKNKLFCSNRIKKAMLSPDLCFNASIRQHTSTGCECLQTNSAGCCEYKLSSNCLFFSGSLHFGLPLKINYLVDICFSETSIPLLNMAIPGNKKSNKNTSL